MRLKVKSLRTLPGLCLTLPAMLLLTSCGNTTLKQPFRSYNRAYADTLNEQMLLNLARLHNGHPPYFLAVGTINNRYNFSSELSSTGEATDTSTDSISRVQTGVGQNSFAPDKTTGLLGIVGRTITNTAATTVGAATGTVWRGLAGGKVAASNSPDFQLIPLNNDIVAKQFLEPISTDVFTTLYQQGFAIDQLLRILIERMEVTLPSGEELILFNSPGAGTPKSFALFLRVCAILREMQRQGEIVLDEKKEDKVIGSLGPGNRPKAKDLALAQERKLSYKKNAEGEWELIEKSASSIFSIRPEHASRIRQHLYGAGISPDHEAIDNVVGMLTRGVVVKGKGEKGSSTHSKLVLRSYSRAMESAAVEQDGFDELMSMPDIAPFIPVMERRPILRTIWAGRNEKLTASLQTVRYMGHTYEVRDPVKSSLDPAVRWNRDTFRLLVALGSQVAVDISKFQRQVLELR